MAGSQCCENPPELSGGGGGGGSVVESYGGLKAYIAGSPDSKLAVLLISDVFGYEVPNFRKLADKTAAAGFFVIVPDFFHGDPLVLDKTHRTTWLEAHSTDKGFEDAKPVVAALKEKGVTAIGAAGFCWGAKVVAEIAKTGDIKAAVMLHPSRVTVDDIKEIKSHISVLGAEIDRASPPELLKQFEEVLSVKPEVDGFVKIFPGVEHGWTVRYDVNDEVAVRSAEEAHKDMIDWKLADKVAAAGFFVLVPDFFFGDPYDPAKLPMQAWLQSHGTTKGFEDAKPVVAALKEKGVAAIGAVGFCWGGKVVAELAKTGDIKASVMLHPSLVTVDDIKENKSHLAVLGAEIDQISPPELVKQFEVVLSANSEFDSYVKIIPGVAHGWTVRYDVNDEAAAKKAEEAHQDMMDWFAKHLE